MPAAGRARLVKRLLRYLGREDIPVAAGMELPLRAFGSDELQRQQDPTRTMNHAAFAEPADPRDDPDEGADAIDLIIRTVEAHPGEIVLACIAPLTNIATVLRRKPSIAGKIRAVVMMGGETALNRHEHNVAFDYIAADIVLTAGIPLTMGTWDVTRRFVLSPDDCRRLADHTAPVNRALARAIELWHPAQCWKPGPIMYDIFPMVWAMDRSCYEVQALSVRVETRGGATCGLTIHGGDMKPIEVTTGMDVEALSRALFRDRSRRLKIVECVDDRDTPLRVRLPGRVRRFGGRAAADSCRSPLC